MPRFLDELSELERLALVDMSYSRISTYEMCKLKYFLHYVTKYPSTYGKAAALGNVLHDVLEDHVGGELDLEEMYKSYDLHRETHDPDHEIDWDLWGQGGQMLAEFVDRHQDDVFDVIGAEVSFEIVIGNAFVRGYIDLVERLDPTTIYIRDWKSGKRAIPKTGKNAAPFNLQLRIYVLACSMLYPEVDTFKAQLYYLRNGVTREAVFTREDLPELERSVVKAFWDITNDKYFPPTPAVHICSFCDHAETGACKLGVMRNKERGR